MKYLIEALAVLGVARLLWVIPVQIRASILVAALVLWLIAYLCSDIDLDQEEQRHD